MQKESPKEALGLGLELSGFIFVSYYAHKPIASAMGYSENMTLSILLTFSLILWTVHAYFLFEKKK